MPIGFRDAATGYANSGTSVAATVPASVQEGDTLFVFQALSEVTVGDPSISGGDAGGSWNLAGGPVDDNNCRTKLWWRTIVSGDASATVTASWSLTAKSGLVLAAYSGTHSSPIDGTPQTVTETGTDTTHDAPGVTPSVADCWVVEFVAQRSGACTTITAPGGRTERSEQLGSGSGTVCQIVADSNGPVTQGVASGAQTYTFNISAANAVGWSVSLRPADVQAVRPSILVSRYATHRASSW